MSRFFALFLAGYAVAQAPIVNPATPCDLSLTAGQMAVNATVATLAGLAILAFLFAAASVAGIAFPRRWWRTLAIVGSVSSAAALAMSFDPLAVPALVIDALLVVVAIRTPAALTTGEALR